jgi:hypothetical protein
MIVGSDLILQDAVGIANSIRRQDKLAPLVGSQEWDWLNPDTQEEPAASAGGVL